MAELNKKIIATGVLLSVAIVFLVTRVNIRATVTAALFTKWKNKVETRVSKKEKPKEENAWDSE